MKKRLINIVCLLLAVLFLSTSCSTLEVTEEMNEAIELYKSAVSASELKNKGKITVTSLLNDEALENKKTESVIEFEYEIKDGKVHFTRTDYVGGKENAKYISDGATVKEYDYESLTWLDKTEANKTLLIPESNPFTTLSLFRVDNKLKLRTDYFKNIESFNQDGQQVVRFTLKDNSVSDSLGYYKADGIVRESAGHTRSYYITSEGYVSKIVISTVQKIITNGESGDYTTEITVVCE